MATVTKKALSKAQILTAVADRVGEDVKRVKEIFETLVVIGHKELRWNGVFVLPGFAKFVVVTKPARPVREGIHPLTKQPATFAATPERRTLRATPVRAIKDSARCGAMAKRIDGPDARQDAPPRGPQFSDGFVPSDPSVPK
jgi:DNA-binding protein HU-beta